MGQGKRAWIYCAIDAPEDRNGALKSQSERAEMEIQQNRHDFTIR